MSLKLPPPPDAAAVHAKAVELGKHVLRMTTEAESGHASSALGLAHLVTDLMYRTMRWDPGDPWNPSADRLVLSEGHAVPIIYAAYADLGGVIGTSPENARPLTPADLLTLRLRDSILDGHPNPAEGFPFFDAATGSLGQGLSAAAGLALAARLDDIDKRIFVLIGDGESREGQVWEAMDFIVDHRLTHVCAIFSANGQGQAGDVSPQQSPQRLAAKAAAFGWEVLAIDGHDPQQVAAALDRAGQDDKPLAIVARTIKGWGAPSLQQGNWHGKPLPKSELAKGLSELDATAAALHARTIGEASPPPARGSAPLRASAPLRETTLPHGRRSTSQWQVTACPPPPPPRTHAPIKLPPLADGLNQAGLQAALEKRSLATRVAYGAALLAAGRIDDRVVSLDGDVSNSTYANLFADSLPGRFFEGKIAEQNIISTAVGLAAAGKIPFASSFAKFLARGYDQVEMASITRANVKLVGSHSGVSLAADGPSQMSLHDVAYFRSMTRVDTGFGRPACHVFHPADAVCAYRCVELMANLDGLCYLRTHRPNAPFLYDVNESFALRGCKKLRDGRTSGGDGGAGSGGAALTLVSSGYMLHTVLQAADELKRRGVPCHVFDVYTFPLDAAPILDAARRAGGVILTVEDNYLGGLHAELAEAAAAFTPATVTAHAAPAASVAPGVSHKSAASAARAPGADKSLRVVGMTCTRIPKSCRTAEEAFDLVGVGLHQIIDRATSLVRPPVA